ncbi:hypothetical protein ACPYO6_11815 [Georgenia sp. Z1344]|uniref:hypothetical protein n=1 Tax=Georgenia sp. Z1344 TaxID=3416706 RepID=UPI003CED6C82
MVSDPVGRGPSTRTARRRALVLVAGATLLTAACQGGGDGGLRAGDDFSVVAAIGEIPAEVAEGAVYVSTADLDSACEANGCTRPEDADDEEAVRDWMSALTGGPAAPDGPVHVDLPDSLGGRTGTMADFRDQVGWSLVDVDSYVSFAVPPSSFTVVTGPEALSDELVEVDDRVLSTSDAEDGWVDPSSASAIDSLGRPVRLTQDEDRTALSLSTASVAAWRAGPEATLADDESLLAVAGAMDDAGVVSSVLARDDFTVPDDAVGPGAARLPPFETVAVGWSGGDDAAITVAYGTGAGQDAEQLATALQDMFDEDVTSASATSVGRPLSDVLVLDDVTVGDSLVTATVRPAAEGRPGTVMEMLHVRDLLFSHR